MKAIRGDNPRTTNQRVYLMPVVPSPPPEKPPTPDVEQFSLPFPLALYIDMPLFYLSVYLFVSLSISPSFPLILTACLSPHLSLVDSLLSPLHSRSRVITLLLSDMSLCYRHNQPALSSLFAPLLAHSLVGLSPSLPHFPAALFATCRTLAHPRDLAQSVLLY